MKPLYQALAHLLNARQNCIRSKNQEWLDKHTERIESLIKAHMPSGSGIDSGTTIDLDASTENKLVFLAPYHHMDENGYYDGWTEHKIIVTPSLAFGIDIKITGRDRNEIKEYLHQCFSSALEEEIEQYAKEEKPA